MQRSAEASRLRTRPVKWTTIAPFSAFQGVNLVGIRALDLVFDQTAQGSLLVSDVEFVTR